MKQSIYMLCLWLLGCTMTVQAQTVYHGQVSVANTVATLHGDQLTLTTEIDLCGLTVGSHQSLSISPMLRNGGDSLLLPPILLNGSNKQKMYQRTVALHGKKEADGGAYRVVKNNPLILLQIPYQKSIVYHPWMEQAELVLIGQLLNYDGKPLQTYVNHLTDQLSFSLEQSAKKVHLR